MSSIQSGFTSATSAVKKVAGRPPSAGPTEVKEQISAGDMEWQPPKHALNAEGEEEEMEGLMFVEDDRAYDALGVSTVWKRPEAKQGDKTKKQRLLAEWKTREERHEQRVERRETALERARLARDERLAR